MEMAEGSKPVLLRKMSNKLTILSKWAGGRMWSELAGDATSDALRIGVMGWLPAKAQRLRRASQSDALCLLVAGGGVCVRVDRRAPAAGWCGRAYHGHPGVHGRARHRKVRGRRPRSAGMSSADQVWSQRPMARLCW